MDAKKRRGLGPVMKRIISERAALALAFLFLTVSLAGCSAVSRAAMPGGADTPGTPDSQPAPDSVQPEEPAQPGDQEETAFPGSYTVPEGWVRAERYSTEEKIFYVEEGHEEDELPDNISIEVGTNRYSADEHERFRDAIVRQLLMQLQGIEAGLTGDGTYTDQGYILYIFTITEPDVTTKQYYIVGDQRYCLVHLTSFTGSENGSEAARSMADSFVWIDTAS